MALEKIKEGVRLRLRGFAQRHKGPLRRKEELKPGGSEGLLRYDTLLNSISTAKNALLTV